MAQTLALGRALPTSREVTSGKNLAKGTRETISNQQCSERSFLFSNVVSDAMEEWCVGLERRLWAMQYSLLRQLDQHQVEHCE